jgi:hypothetical protein
LRSSEWAADESILPSRLDPSIRTIAQTTMEVDRAPVYRHDPRQQADQPPPSFRSRRLTINDEPNGGRDEDDRLRKLALAVVRGEVPWQTVLDHGLVVRPAPPFDVMEGQSDLPTIEVKIDDLVAGLRAHAAAKTDLRVWAFVVIGADFADFGDITDTELGDRVVSLLWDAAAGWKKPATVAEELDHLGFSTIRDQPTIPSDA